MLGRLLLACALAFPLAAATLPDVPTLGCDGGGASLVEDVGGGLVKETHLLCERAASGPVARDLTDCAAQDHAIKPYRWASGYYARVDPRHAYGLVHTAVLGSNFYTGMTPTDRAIRNQLGFSDVAILDALTRSARAWDDEVGAQLLNTFLIGGSSEYLGRLDNANQHGWTQALGPGVIAQTTTWYYPSTGLVAESDVAYSSSYAWSLGGEPLKMDLQNIATHELGHTFGLDHPGTQSSNGCLTMYYTGGLGETQKRTLGDGDILGIRARYP